MLDGKTNPISFDGASFIDDLFDTTIEIRRKGIIVRHGELGRTVRLLRQGLAIRYMTTPQGDRQIVGLVFPGQFCNVTSAAFGKADYEVESQTDCEVSIARVEDIRKRFDESGSAAWEFFSKSLVETSIATAWITNLSRRTGHERVAHLLCEVHARTRTDAFGDGEVCPFPFTQQDIADIVGLSIVHVNRILQDLRRQKTIAIRSKLLRILDWERLSAAADFAPTYLQPAIDFPTIPDRSIDGAFGYPAP